MKIFNRIIILFLIVMASMVYGVFTFLQSEYFSQSVTNIISRYLLKQKNISLTFHNIELRPFSLKTKLIDAKFSYEMAKKQKIEVVADEIWIQVDFVDLFRDDFRISTFGISKGVGLIQSGPESGILKIETNVDWPAYIKEKIPIEIKKLQIINTFVEWDKRADFLIEELDLDFKKTGLNLRSKIIDVSSDMLKLKKIDAINVDAFLSSDTLSLEALKLFSSYSSFELSGKYIFGSADNRMGFKAEIPLDGVIAPMLDSYFESGHLKTSGEVVFGEQVSIEGEAEAEDVLSRDLDFREIKLNYSYSNGKIHINRANISDGIGVGNIERACDVQIGNKWGDTNFNCLITMEHFDLTKGLYSLRDSLSIIKGRADGSFWLKKDLGQISVLAVSQLGVEDFKLEVEGKDILARKEIYIEGLKVVASEDDIEIEGTVVFENSRVPVKGAIIKGKFDIRSSGGFIDFGKFSKISGVPITGSGPIDISVLGSKKKIKLGFKVSATDFSAVGINVKKIDSEFDFELFTQRLNIRHLGGSYGDTIYSGNGFIDFSKNNMGLKIGFDKTTYQEVEDILRDMVPGFKKIPKGLSAALKGKISVTGKIDGGGPNVDADILGEGAYLAGEFFNRFSFRFSKKDDGLKFSDIKVRKGNGLFLGRYTFSESTKQETLQLMSSNLRISDLDFASELGLDLDGELGFDIDLVGVLPYLNGKFNIFFKNALLSSEEIEDGKLEIYFRKEKIKILAQLFKDEIAIESLLSLQEGDKKNSYIAIRTAIPKLRKYFGIISPGNMQKDDLEGNLFFDLNVDFNFYKPLHGDVIFNLADFYIKDGMKMFTLDKRSSGVLIEDGEIRTLNISTSSNVGDAFSLQGEGKLFKNFKIIQTHTANIGWLDLLSKRVRSASGFLKAKGVLIGDKGNISNYFEISGKNMSASVESVPAQIKDVSLSAIFENSRLLIKEIKGKFGEGDFQGSGMIQFKIPYPVVAINLNCENNYIPLFKNSGVFVSVKGDLSGNEPPYLFTGDIGINKLKVLDEFGEMAGNSVSLRQYGQFLPDGHSATQRGPVALALNVSLLSPAEIKNSRVEMSLIGDMKVGGGVYRPLLAGDFETQSLNSKFKFKGHDFKIKSGLIRFDNSEDFNPYLNFEGESIISDYTVVIKLSGESKKMAVKFESNPSLPQEEILSLIALGVTSDISKKLVQKERANITTVGLGTLLLDQLKLNEGLSSTLGVRLSVQPEFAEDEDRLLRGKSAVNESNDTNMRSSTNIKIQKKINKKVDLSVSSTVGGTADQKQEMNLNYNINKKWSVEGVYEIKSSADDEESGNSSLGADVIMKWSF